jgi:hypothetical protein
MNIYIKCYKNIEVFSHILSLFFGELQTLGFKYYMVWEIQKNIDRRKKVLVQILMHRRIIQIERNQSRFSENPHSFR